MRFGDSTEFAIEAYHEPSGAEWPGFGRMCVEIQGVRLGDIRENHCSLFHAVNRFRELTHTIHTLWDESFTTLSDAQRFAALDHALYIVEDRDWKRFGRFEFLTNTGEQFDDAKTYITCRPDGCVQVLYRFRDFTCGSASCGIESFRSVAESFVLWFDEQVRTTAPSFFPVNPLP